MPENSKEKGNEIVDTTKKLELLRNLISNQYSVLHHSEKYITDLIKIISIIIGIVSFLGIPQLLLFQHENIVIATVARSLGVAILTYAILCCCIVIYSILYIGGLNLRLSGTFKPSLWWYDDPEIMKLRKVKNPEELFKKVKRIQRSVLDELSKSEEETLDDETLTFTLMLLRTQEQLEAARKIRYGLVYGLFLALGFFIAGLLPLLFP